MKELTPGIRRLKEIIDAQSSMSVSRAARCLAEAQLDITDLLPYADHDHSVDDGYGRIMVVDAGRYEIMVMTWNPGDFSAVHDHGHTMWGAVQVFGHVLHHTFNVSDGTFRLSKKEILPDGSIIKVNHPLVHQMGNVTSAPYLTLHLYGNDDLKGNITADSRIFEPQTGLIKHTRGGAFFNLPEKEVYDIEKMPQVDHATLVHQTAILLNYYQRFDEQKADYLSRTILNRLELCKN